MTDPGELTLVALFLPAASFLILALAAPLEGTEAAAAVHEPKRA